MERIVASVEVKDFRDSLGAKLVDLVCAAGYTPASAYGIREDALRAAESYGGSLGVLVQDQRDLPERRFFGLLRRRPRMRFIAVIWTSNQARKASEGDWVVDANGRENLDEVIALVKALTEKFDTNALVRLIHEAPKYEVFHSDWDY